MEGRGRCGQDRGFLHMSYEVLVNSQDQTPGVEVKMFLGDTSTQTPSHPSLWVFPTKATITDYRQALPTLNAHSSFGAGTKMGISHHWVLSWQWAPSSTSSQKHMWLLSHHGRQTREADLWMWWGDKKQLSLQSHGTAQSRMWQFSPELQLRALGQVGHIITRSGHGS